MNSDNKIKPASKPDYTYNFFAWIGNHIIAPISAALFIVAILYWIPRALIGG